MACHVWSWKRFLFIIYSMPSYFYQEDEDFFSILSNTTQVEIQELQRRRIRSPEKISQYQHVMFENWNAFLSSFTPYLFIFIVKMMMFCEFSFNQKTAGELGGLEVEGREPWIQIRITACYAWNLKQIFTIISSMTFYHHWEDDDVLCIFFLIQKKLRARKFKEGR